MIDLDALEALAKAAQGNGMTIDDAAAFCDATTPAAILELCAEVRRLREALQQIAGIENKMVGGDWDEIEEARQIALQVLEKA